MFIPTKKKHSMCFFVPSPGFPLNLPFCCSFFPTPLTIEASRPRSKELAWLKSRYSKPWEFHKSAVDGWWIPTSRWGEERLVGRLKSIPPGFLKRRGFSLALAPSPKRWLVDWLGVWDFWSIDSTDFFDNRFGWFHNVEENQYFIDEKYPVATRNTSKISRIKMECWWNLSKRYWLWFW